MYKIILLIALVVLLGCSKPGESKAPVSNGNFDVTRLFTTDGCTLYRFEDAGENRYFSKCISAMKSEVSYDTSHTCGKGCTRTDVLTTPTN